MEVRVALRPATSHRLLIALVRGRRREVNRMKKLETALSRRKHDEWATPASMFIYGSYGSKLGCVSTVWDAHVGI
jgi:hypothetical protein